MSPATSTSNAVVAVAAVVDSASTTQEVIVPVEGASIQELCAAVEAFDHLLDDLGLLYQECPEDAKYCMKFKLSILSK